MVAYRTQGLVAKRWGDKSIKRGPGYVPGPQGLCAEAQTFTPALVSIGNMGYGSLNQTAEN